jgi:aldehyde dehydrogenase family protein
VTDPCACRSFATCWAARNVERAVGRSAPQCRWASPRWTLRRILRLPWRTAGSRGRTWKCARPVNGSVVGVVPEQGAGEVRAAVARLRREQPAWEALGPSGRGEWVGRLRDWLLDNDERLAELLRRETGKPWLEAALEVRPGIDLLEYYRKRAAGFLADSHPRPRPADREQEAPDRVPAVSGRGRHLPLQLPRLVLPRRCSSRPVGRRGGRDQAV